jgi:AcrR family transcriptional regulator
MKQEAKSPTATGAPATLWDRTRRLASREILETALRLFTEQGYDETTIAQIAREAGVSQRTLFRYFGTKEDLLGGDQDRFGQVLTDTIRAQPAEAGVWAALRAGVAAVLALHDSREQALERFRLLHNTASLRAGWLEKRLRFQEDLLPLITERMDAASAVGNKGPRARAVIATAFACLDAASMTWVDNDGEGDIMDLYDECLAAVRG